MKPKMVAKKASGGTARLENWSCKVITANPYMPPESGALVLRGTVYNHPKRNNGSPVVTSYVVESEGRVVTTKSGTRYHLGRMSRSYSVWCRKHGIKIDRKHPVIARKPKADSAA